MVIAAWHGICILGNQRKKPWSKGQKKENAVKFAINLGSLLTEKDYVIDVGKIVRTNEKRERSKVPMEKETVQTVCPKEMDTVEKINEWFEVNIWSKIEEQE